MGTYKLPVYDYTNSYTKVLFPIPVYTKSLQDLVGGIDSAGVEYDVSRSTYRSFNTILIQRHGSCTTAESARSFIGEVLGINYAQYELMGKSSLFTHNFGASSSSNLAPYFAFNYEEYTKNNEPWGRASVGWYHLNEWVTNGGIEARRDLGYISNALFAYSPNTGHITYYGCITTRATGGGGSWFEVRLMYSTEITEDNFADITGDPDNPYADGGDSSEGGGDSSRQNWDNNSDAITPDALPTKGAINSGMLSVFSPTSIQVQDLADLLYSYNFFDWLQKNLQNLEEIFVSFGVVPFTVTKGSTASVTWLGFDISQFTHPVYLTRAAQQFYEIDMGSIALNGTDPRIHASDSVFDYSPFSRLGIYLPFIGYQELDIDECRGNTINLVYRVDIVSGSCVALIYVNGDKERCIYQFSGNCLTQIPLGSVDMSGIISASVNIAVAAASAGASSAISSAGDAMNEGFHGDNMSQGEKDYAHAQNAARVSNAAGSLASATINGIMGMKPNFKHSGAIGAAGAGLSVKQPYLFLVTPREAVPRGYQRYCGFPCNIADNLGNFSGYTVVEDIRLNGLVATSAEVEEIYQLLKSGVIV